MMLTGPGTDGHIVLDKIWFYGIFETYHKNRSDQIRLGRDENLWKAREMFWLSWKGFKPYQIGTG